LYLPDLAHSLANLGPTLVKLHHHPEALTIGSEAVTLYQKLAKANPDRYRAELSRSLDALSLAKAWSGRADAVPPDAPLPRWPIVKIIGPGDQQREPGEGQGADGLQGPLVMTFTARLPFPLGLADGGSYVFGVPGQWMTPDASDTFGDTAFVVIRLCNVTAPRGPWLPHAGEVLAKLYQLDSAPEVSELGQDDEAYEQWITLETPDARLDSDDSRDDGFTFHRCLEVLNRFLRAHYTIFRDTRVRPITTRDVGPVVFRGAYDAQTGREWHFIGPMVMHPDAYPRDPDHRDPHDSLDDLLASYKQLDLHPFLTSSEWLRRAEYARRYTGDNSAIIISLQISMESMLYRTFGMLLVDQGHTYAEISSRLGSTPGVKPLLVTILPELLGGRWDTKALDTPVGKYWHRLYRLRNQIVHRGHQATWAEAEAAYESYVDMREFINQRLWSNHRKYPRTLLIKIGDGGLERRGWNTRWIKEFRRNIASESGFFYLPKDLAGR